MNSTVLSSALGPAPDPEVFRLNGNGVWLTEKARTPAQRAGAPRVFRSDSARVAPRQSPILRQTTPLDGIAIEEQAINSQEHTPSQWTLTTTPQP